MKISIKVTLLVAVIFVFSTPVPAQWPPYSTPNVPQTADGEPDLEGPVPRTAEGKPDFSGIWQRSGRRFGRRNSDAPEPELPPGTPPAATFFSLGANIEGGLPFQPWARELMEQRMADDMKDNPDAHCLPMGHMQLHGHPQPRKIIQTPDVMLMLYEGNAGIRQIFTDGRSSPDNDPQPWWYGYSVGSWDGDTLVVTTTHLRDRGWLDVNGSPITDKGVITERFTRINYGNMNIDVTIDDPEAYTEPFTVRVTHRIMFDTNLIEFICLENEQSSQYFDR